MSFLAADCEKAWLHEGLEDTMRHWYDWVGEMKKKDEVKKLEEVNISQMIKKSADGSAGAFVQDHQAHGMERQSQEVGSERAVRQKKCSEILDHQEG